jgi:hypothetical protein
MMTGKQQFWLAALTLICGTLAVLAIFAPASLTDQPTSEEPMAHVKTLSDHDEITTALSDKHIRSVRIAGSGIVTEMTLADGTRLTGAMVVEAPGE